MNHNIVDMALAVPWLIEPSWFEVIFDVLSRDGSIEAAVMARTANQESDIKALLAVNAEELHGSYGSYVSDGVGILPVHGPISRHMNLMSEISGGASTDLMIRDFEFMMNNPKIEAIVLDLDTPGGAATGINEFAQMIYEARSQKPVVSYVGGSAASAGYWLASATSQIIVDPTSGLGSIGVVMGYRDTKGRDEKLGVKNIEVVSSISPMKRATVDTPEGLSELQNRVDAVADVFIAAVARNRSVSRETVLADFGKGGVLIGQQAVNSGLADRIGSLKSVISEFSNKPTTGSKNRGVNMNDEIYRVSSTAELNAALESLGFDSGSIEIASNESEIEAAATNATVAERERISSLIALCDSNLPTAVIEAINVGTSVGDTAVALLKAKKEKGSLELKDIINDSTSAVTDPLSKDDKKDKSFSNALGMSIAKASK